MCFRRAASAARITAQAMLVADGGAFVQVEGESVAALTVRLHAIRDETVVAREAHRIVTERRREVGDRIGLAILRQHSPEHRKAVAMIVDALAELESAVANEFSVRQKIAALTGPDCSPPDFTPAVWLRLAGSGEVELGCGWVAVSGRFLHVLKLRARIITC